MPTALGIYVTVDDLKARLGLTDTANDFVLGQICDETNQWIESYAGRVLAPVDSAVYTFDGGGPEVRERQMVDVSYLGVRAISLLEVATTTGGAFTTVASTEYFIRPLNRNNGEPATKIVLDTGNVFHSGYGTVRVTMTAGFATIPDDVRGVAIAIATRAWHGRQSGMADVVGNETTGAPFVTKVVAPEFKRTLDRYRPVLVR